MSGDTRKQRTAFGSLVILKFLSANTHAAAASYIASSYGDEALLPKHRSPRSGRVMLFLSCELSRQDFLPRLKSNVNYVSDIEMLSLQA